MVGIMLSLLHSAAIYTKKIPTVTTVKVLAHPAQKLYGTDNKVCNGTSYPIYWTMSGHSTMPSDRINKSQNKLYGYFKNE
jgi:hypothetical protein